MRTTRWCGVAGGLSGALAVLAGAFGAHALRGVLAADALAIFDTGARYHLVHAVALLALAGMGAGRPSAALAWAGALFVAGTVLFSGSLYLLALTGVRAWGAVTPAGGVALVAAWVAAALGGWRLPARSA